VNFGFSLHTRWHCVVVLLLYLNLFISVPTKVISDRDRPILSIVHLFDLMFIAILKSAQGQKDIHATQQANKQLACAFLPHIQQH